MQKRTIHFLILLLTLIFGSVTPAWARTGSQEAGRQPWVNLKSSSHPFVSKTFEKVELVQVPPVHYSEAGTHAEFYAVNDALHAMGENANFDDLVMYVLRSKTGIDGTRMVKFNSVDRALKNDLRFRACQFKRCGNCKGLTSEVRTYSDD